MDVLSVCTGIKNIRSHLTFIENPITGEEEADMCKGLNDIEKHALKKGKKLGEINALCSLVVDGILKIEDAAKRARLSGTDFSRKLTKYKKQHFLVSERKC